MNEVIHETQVAQPRTRSRRQGSNSTAATDNSSLSGSSSAEATPNIWSRTRTAFISTARTMRGFLSSGNKERGSPSRPGTSSSTSDLESQLQQNIQAEERQIFESNPDHSDKASNHSTSHLPADGNGGEIASDHSEQSNRSVNNLDPSKVSKASQTGQGAGQDFDHNHLSHSGQYSPTMPIPQQVKVFKPDPPDRNLHEFLLRGYYQPGTTNYQPRRTLDQYIYADIEATSYRDDDQVVYRYTRGDPHFVPKLFMVDQLWLWILGKGS
jgi:hypothetical protein